ncbi:MAG: hypothetical protein WCW01_03540 [Gammaproteobacteria bacterium]
MSIFFVSQGVFGKLFYSRQQGNSTYNFYIKDRRLVAEVIKAGASQVLPTIDIPTNLQLEINIKKLQKLKTVFDQSFFTVQGEKISVNARGLGGWGDEVHRGYECNGEGKWEVGLLEKACVHVGHFDEKKERHANGFGIGTQGTYQWAIDVGLGNNAARIAYYSNDVDYDEKTRPVIPHHDPQGWHFNVLQNSQDGSLSDSRIKHALEKLIAAVSLYKNGEFGEAFRNLGQGLHPLQDVFAHTNAFIKDFNIEVDGLLHWRFQYHRGIIADEPHYIDPKKSSESIIPEPEEILELKDNPYGHFSQRYSDTKTATYLYLLLFRLAVEPNFASQNYATLADQLGIAYRTSLVSSSTFKIKDFVSEFRKQVSHVPIPDDTKLGIDSTSSEERSTLFYIRSYVSSLNIFITRYRDLARGCCSSHVNSNTLNEMRTCSHSLLDKVNVLMNIVKERPISKGALMQVITDIIGKEPKLGIYHAPPGEISILRMGTLLLSCQIEKSHMDEWEPMRLCSDCVLRKSVSFRQHIDGFEKSGIFGLTKATIQQVPSTVSTTVSTTSSSSSNFFPSSPSVISITNQQLMSTTSPVITTNPGAASNEVAAQQQKIAAHISHIISTIHNIQSKMGEMKKQLGGNPGTGGGSSTTVATASVISATTSTATTTPTIGL